MYPLSIVIMVFNKYKKLGSSYSGSALRGYLTMIEKTFTIIDNDGIHARPAAILVSNISQFGSEIKLENKKKIINLKSIKSLMELGIRKGDRIKVLVEGLDEEEAFLEVEAALKISGTVSM